MSNFIVILLGCPACAEVMSDGAGDFAADGQYAATAWNSTR